jgi:hypothetical protein
MYEDYLPFREGATKRRRGFSTQDRIFLVRCHEAAEGMGGLKGVVKGNNNNYFYI